MKAALQHHSANPAPFLCVPCCMPIPDLPICVLWLNYPLYSNTEAENVSCAVEATTNHYVEPYCV